MSSWVLAEVIEVPCGVESGEHWGESTGQRDPLTRM